MNGKKLTRRQFLQLGGAAGAATLIAAGGYGWFSRQDKGDGSEFRLIGLQEPWRNNGENAPFHTAISAGYYADEGLQVKLVEGGPGINGAISVLSGAQDIEVGCNASVGAMIPQISQGLPFIITGVILQKHPLGFVTLVDKLTSEQRSRPLTPDDLRGKKVGVQGDQELLALLKKNNIPASEVEIVLIAGENPVDLLTQQVDYASYWVVNQPWGLVEQGLEWKALMFAEWGVPLYADVIYTTQERLKKDPELMRAFLRATVRGMKKMIEDPEFAVAASLKFGDKADTEAKLRWRIGLQNEMMVSEDAMKHSLGWIDPAKLQEQINFFAETQQVESVPDANNIMSNDYLPKED